MLLALLGTFWAKMMMLSQPISLKQQSCALASASWAASLLAWQGCTPSAINRTWQWGWQWHCKCVGVCRAVLQHSAAMTVSSSCCHCLHTPKVSLRHLLCFDGIARRPSCLYSCITHVHRSHQNCLLQHCSIMHASDVCAAGMLVLPVSPGVAAICSRCCYPCGRRWSGRHSIVPYGRSNRLCLLFVSSAATACWKVAGGFWPCIDGESEHCWRIAAAAACRYVCILHGLVAFH